tara:strand:- start:314 stop:3217 length:2904 start_codon:yes stop_codon:yes gene_type:complete
MTNSYRGTEFNVVGQARDTFVKPTSKVEVQKSGFDVIADSLATLNPALQKLVGLETKKAIEEEKLKGFNLAVRENRREGGFKTVVDELRKNKNEGITRRFIGGSVFAQDAFNEGRAALLGNRIGTEVNTLYETSLVDVPLFDDGVPVLDENQQQVTTKQPLWKFPTNSPEYKNFLADANALGSYEAEGLDPKDQLKFLNKVNTAIEKKTIQHDKNFKEYNFNLITSDMNENLLTSWTLTKDSDLSVDGIQGFESDEEELKALADSYIQMNEKIKRDYSIGITSSKEKKYYENMIANIESVALQINQKFGEDEAKDFIKWAANIKYGNGTNTLLQHKDFATKMFALKVKIAKEHDRIRETKEERDEEDAKNFVDETINDLFAKQTTVPNAAPTRLKFLSEEGQQAIQSLYQKIPDFKEIIDDAIDLYNGDRKASLMEFRLTINSGEYDDDPTQAGQDLLLLVEKMGGYSRITKTENTMIEKIVSDIKSIPDNQLVGGFKYYSKEIDNKIYGTFDLFREDDGNIKVDNFLALYGEGGTNKKYNLNLRQSSVIADKVRRNIKLQFQKWRDTGDVKTAQEVQDYFDNILMGDGAQSIDAAITRILYPTDIPVTLFARDGSIKTIKVNKFNNTDLYNKFRSGSHSNINPPAELFKDFKIEDKFKEPYFPADVKEIEAKTNTKSLREITDDVQGTKKKNTEQGFLPKEQRPKSMLNNIGTNIANLLTGSTPLSAGTLEDAPLIYKVQSGDNLSVIAERYNVSVEDIVKLNNIKDPSLISIDQVLQIPKNPVNSIFDFKSSEISEFTDYGGFARIIRDGESSNNYTAVNYGERLNYKGGVIEGLDNTRLSDVIEDLKGNKYNAAGAYQFQLEPLKETIKAAGLSLDDKFTADVQDRLFWARMMNSIRLDARDYIIGKSDDLDAALLDIAQEFAAAPMSNGKGYYDGDEAGNKANIDLELLKSKLKLARKQITGK